jgi:hypothetical protein
MAGGGVVINGGSASIANTGGGFLNFVNASTAGSATITNTGDLRSNPDFRLRRLFPRASA